MTTFKNTYGDKTLTIAGEYISLKTNGTLGVTAQVKESDKTAIAASVLELYGTPEKATDYNSASSAEEYANVSTSDEGLLWQAYARLKALGIRAERKAAQEAEKAAKEEVDALLEETKQAVALTFTGKYFSELGTTKKALVNALAHQQIALDEARKNGATQ